MMLYCTFKCLTSTLVAIHNNTKLIIIRNVCVRKESENKCIFYIKKAIHLLDLAKSNYVYIKLY